MKVALVNKFYPPTIGGIEYHVRLLAETLAKSDEIESISIIVANDRNNWQYEQSSNKIFITRVPNWRTIASTPIAPALISYLHKVDADIFHFHFPYPFGDIAWLLSGMKKPFVITYHSDIVRQRFLNQVYAPFRNSFFTKADKILATSPCLINSSKVLQKFRDKTIAVPLGIDPSRFLTSKAREAGIILRKRYNDKPIVLFVGRLVYYKGVEILIEAFKGIDANLIMVGKGPLREHLMSMVKTYKLQNNVYFFDEVDDNTLTAYFHACDIFVLPSVATTEAYGLVQLEAQACAKPVISTNLPTGVPYVNKHMVSGIIVEPGSILQLQSAILTLINDKKLRLTLGENGKKRMMQNFTNEIMTNKIINIYKEVLK